MAAIATRHRKGSCHGIRQIMAGTSFASDWVTDVSRSHEAALPEELISTTFASEVVCSQFHGMRPGGGLSCNSL